MKQEFHASEAVRRHQPVDAQSSRPKLADSLATMLSCRRGQVIYNEGAPVECCYRNMSGTARRFIVRPDGRRQIIDLLFAGDVFGFGTRGTHAFTAEAITDGTIVARFPRSRLEALARSDTRIAHEVQEMVLEETRRLQDLITILGRITAQEKVAAFLLYLADRLAGEPADRVMLPISRYDIADYLALSVETVSRALTTLKRNGIISFTATRQIRITCRQAIETSNPFGPPADTPHNGFGRAVYAMRA